MAERGLMLTYARRLKLIEQHMTGLPKTAFEGSEDILEAAGLTHCFSDSVNAIRKGVAERLAPHTDLITSSYDKDVFPGELKGLLRSLDILGLEHPEFGIRSQDLIEKGAIYLELSKADASFATFVTVQQGLATSTIVNLGSEAQKAKYIPALCKADIIGCWALSEPDAGSDASSLELSANPVEGGYRLNGYKKWIGNASLSDIMIVFGRNSKSNKVIGFIVDSKSQGISIENAKHKLALRVTRNGLIEFKNVFVPFENQLEKALDFASGPNKILTLSRLAIGWIALGQLAGAYQNTIRQLKSTIVNSNSLPAIRSKLNRVLALFKGYFLLMLHQTKLFSQGNISVGHVSLVKGEASRAVREGVHLTCEILQENGLKLDSYVIKALADSEVIYTYEGSYDINMLVAGRELTGIASIRAPFTLR